ncbi:MAG TPA: phosphoglycerate dehydrogenase [Balneola sp.]|jgi:D-3-phosphoglycerate dehydrogenase / 2-oxoglutarate reductase|nr:phosphoglycerate dehydrogenase [Balneola sp.]MAO78602.1 phosphoglycerate dehydrogenase [Balneola sp.]MBF63169.1 phosphoglycerate dehydrogenase [Balneola sp.]HAH51243.1 phosphoglycerate dehydrogenase [Balneola sp.]|tara:strand:- start:1626 stop:3215 length:1590 start_codon:yes stop_codon:yes gene_type:complete
MSFKVLLLDGVDPVCANIFKERGIQADQPGKLSPEELNSQISNYDGMVVRSATTVTPELLEKATNMKVIGRAGVGVDNIDIKAATTKGILVMNTPDGNTISTAEHTCGMIIALARNIPTSVATVKNGGWDRKKYMGSEVFGKKLGIVGLGKIGSEVAKRMQSFGMEVFAYDPFTTKEHASDMNIELVDIDELLGNVDFLSVHTPLTEKTKGLVSLKNADKLKKGIRLVNCARGGIYEEADLPKLIDDGIVGGVALDVYSQEPPNEELYKVLEHPGIICTPHLGASTEEAQEKVAEQIASQMSDALENKNYKGSLNGKSISLLTNEEVQPYLQLAEKLGAMAVQLSPEHASSLEFEYSGDCTKFADVLTDGILKGMLSNYVEDSVNLINARYFADERGFSIKEILSSKGKTFNDLVTIRFAEGSEYRSISAAVFGENDYRIVQIDKYGIELRLEGDIILYQNQDMPGMLASVSGALAQQQINIGALGLGRTEKGSNAITALTVDKKLDDTELDVINKLEGIQHVRYVSFS